VQRAVIMNLRYAINETEFLELSETATSAFEAHKQVKRRKEAGGILLGTVYPSERVLISEVTLPSRFDKAGLYFFDRSRRRAQQIVDRCWKRSSGECVYLGEWHTHPEPVPSPSGRDRMMIRNMFDQTQMEIDFLFLVVVGTESTWVGIQNQDGMRSLEPVLNEGAETVSSVTCRILM